jgi:hypothetical protein
LRKQNPAKKKEWELLRDWILDVTKAFQIKQGMRSDVAFCAICGMFHSWEDMTVDHEIERSKAPELLYDISNLRPAGKRCNHPDVKKKFALAGQSGSPDALNATKFIFSVTDIEYGGRRPRIKQNKKEWAVTKYIKAHTDL